MSPQQYIAWQSLVRIELMHTNWCILSKWSIFLFTISLGHAVHKDWFIKIRTRTVVKLLLFWFEFLWISLYIHVCTYLLAETCSTEMRHAYGREQKSFAVWFELICHHNLCIAVEFMRKEINTVYMPEHVIFSYIYLWRFLS